mmetsp:Transcript_30119/g.39664  ORF Transcript_30119/g.39664 Transcript_30119/m.39664 type:complete len:85 (-) Transcript_30119:123-377(-)
MSLMKKHIAEMNGNGWFFLQFHADEDPLKLMNQKQKGKLHLVKFQELAPEKCQFKIFNHRTLLFDIQRNRFKLTIVVVHVRYAI